MVEEAIPVLDFDTTTKPEGTKNAKVQNKIKYEEKEKKRLKDEALLKSLHTLEKDATEALSQEVVVILAKEMLDKLKEVFDNCKEKDKKDIDECEAEELVHSIAEDEYFEQQLNTFVRESLDGVKETLESLLIRVKTTFKEPVIQWHTFLGFFSRRGRLRENEHINLQLKKQRRLSGSDFDDDEKGDQEVVEDAETKRVRLQKQLKQKLVKKENLVPKTGKGRFNVTVPVPFEFMNQEKGFSIRQKKVEKMIQERKKEEERALSFEYKAREIPAHVKKEKYLELMQLREKKRQDTKRLAMAKIKATEKPFSFYERDAKHQ